MKTLGVTSFFVCLLVSLTAVSYEIRRPGTIGAYSDRRLTQARNSLGVVMGPNYHSLLGSRIADTPGFDGGYQLIRPDLRTTGTANGSSSDLIHQGNIGIMFGIFDDWEAGAIFLPFTFAPEFSYDAIRVAITYSNMNEHVDFGFRLHMKTPGDSDWGLSPGMPILARIGSSGRIDAGVYVPVLLEDHKSIGLNVPLQAALNFTVQFYAGLESGVYIPDFRRLDELGVRVPLGVFAGYTMLIGGSLFDITTKFIWDDGVYMGVEEYETLQYEAFRFAVGLSWRKMVK